MVEVTELNEIEGDKNKTKALMRHLLDQFEQYLKLSRKVKKEIFTTVSDIENPGRLADMIASHLPLKIKEKQTILETVDVPERLRHLVEFISNEKKILDLEKKIGQRVKTSMEKNTKRILFA